MTTLGNTQINFIMNDTNFKKLCNCHIIGNEISITPEQRSTQNIQRIMNRNQRWSYEGETGK